MEPENPFSPTFINSQNVPSGRMQCIVRMRFEFKVTSLGLSSMKIILMIWASVVKRVVNSSVVEFSIETTPEHLGDTVVLKTSSTNETTPGKLGDTVVLKTISTNETTPGQLCDTVVLKTS